MWRERQKKREKKNVIKLYKLSCWALVACVRHVLIPNRVAATPTATRSAVCVVLVRVSLLAVCLFNDALHRMTKVFSFPFC